MARMEREPHQVDIDLSRGGVGGKVEVDGQDLAPMIRGFELRYDPDGYRELTLHCVAAVRFRGEVTVTPEVELAFPALDRIYDPALRSGIALALRRLADEVEGRPVVDVSSMAGKAVERVLG